MASASALGLEDDLDVGGRSDDRVADDLDPVGGEVRVDVLDLLGRQLDATERAVDLVVRQLARGLPDLDERLHLAELELGSRARTVDWGGGATA